MIIKYGKPLLYSKFQTFNLIFKFSIKLNKFVMVKFDQDSVVVPRGTEWFGFYELGQAQTMLNYNETQLYQEDWIGLKTLDENGKVDFLVSEGDHLQFSDKFLYDIIKNYLSD